MLVRDKIIQQCRSVIRSKYNTYGRDIKPLNRAFIESFTDDCISIICREVDSQHTDVFDAP